MATKQRNRQAEFLAEWKQTNIATAANATELPHLEAPRTGLERILEEFQSLSTQQDVLAASRQEISKRMKQLMVEGNRTAAFLRAGARQQFGPDSEKLVEFGIQPFRGIRRKKGEPETPAEPTPQPTPTVNK
jgi:hypothetical protein